MRGTSRKAAVLHWIKISFYILKYDFLIAHHREKSNLIADALSRLDEARLHLEYLLHLFPNAGLSSA